MDSKVGKKNGCEIGDWQHAMPAGTSIIATLCDKNHVQRCQKSFSQKEKADKIVRKSYFF
ncbi:MAG: hypothetical protein HY842_13340 [Bacteroidetes bacterium]|nr:hypothetical protein [Bacteroidota bacterium]